MIRALIDNPLLLLFVVAAIGYPLGRVRVCGSSLGVAAVLFVGLAIGSLDPALKLPEIVYMLGLALFVYTVGLSSASAFASSPLREALRRNLLAIGILAGGALLTLLLRSLCGLKGTMAVGMYTGSFTNTPALAGVLETLKGLVPPATLQQALAEPVVGYSIAYPFGVVGVLLAVALVQRLWHVDYAAEARSLRIFGASNDPLRTRIVLVTRPAAIEEPIAGLCTGHPWRVLFGRIKRNGGFLLAEPSGRLALGDLVVVVGTAADLDLLTAHIGEESAEDIQHEESGYDLRRIFVSSRATVGRRISELHIAERHGALITRVRRGDDDVLPHADMVLEAGDRVRVLAPRRSMSDLTELFGDSYRAVSEVDILTFSFGLALGLLLGMVPFPLPGGITFRLGFAGGPLMVALLLGIVGRTGRFVWTLPYSANMTLRQIGLVLFLAGIGTRAGYGFLGTFTSSGGLAVLLGGAGITFLAALAALWIGHRLMRIPMNILLGIVAGIYTQPAVLGYALEQTGNELPNSGYASVFPVAMIAKILLAQALLSQTL